MTMSEAEGAAHVAVESQKAAGDAAFEEGHGLHRPARPPIWEYEGERIAVDSFWSAMRKNRTIPRALCEVDVFDEAEAHVSCVS